MSVRRRGNYGLSEAGREQAVPATDVEGGAAALQRGLGRTVCRKITGQALAHAPLAQCRTEVLPVMGDFIGEIAGKFKTRDRPVGSVLKVEMAILDKQSKGIAIDE